MPIDTQALQDHRFATITQTYGPRDTILYALGLGLGADPLDEDDLDYLLEGRAKVLPPFAGTLASPGMWIRDPAFGVDFGRLVHAEQETIFFGPLPSAADVRSTPKIAALHDRGEGKGAVLVVERDIETSEQVQLAKVRQTLLLRGDGGFGGDPPPPAVARALPDRSADHVMEIAISPRAALIYRLSGDWNPLHADPVAARAGGFDRPILHGLASYGIAGHAVMRATGHSLARLACRFSGIVFPGDHLRVALWQDGDRIAFEAHVGDRRVLDRGTAVLEKK